MFALVIVGLYRAGPGLTLAGPGVDFALVKEDTMIGNTPGETLLIDTNSTFEGNIIVVGQGVVLIDGATLDLLGNIGCFGAGKVLVRDGAVLHFRQSYVGQFYVWMTDSSRFEAYDSRVDANGSIHFAELHERATYIAERTSFPDWTFRKVFDRSTLVLQDISHVGDLMVDDSCQVHMIRCDTLMPWFQAPEGSVMQLSFPQQDSVAHFELSSSTPGVDGIGYSFTVDTCRQCWWSLETYPGCSVVVSNSEIRGSCVRMPGSDTIRVSGIFDYTFHPDLLVSLEDRHLEYVNTYVWWWNWYPMGKTVFLVDSCQFGEMIGKDSSVALATRSIHDGATVTLAAKHFARVEFKDGESWGFVSCFDSATLLLDNARVVPQWPYQTDNIAHNRGKMLCVNSYFENLPYALDTALVMFAAIDTLDTLGADTLVPITGSAWIHAGPYNPAIFQGFELWWAHDTTGPWHWIDGSSEGLQNDTLGVWDTHGLSPGDYLLRLVIFDNAGDSLSALMPAIISGAWTGETRSSGPGLQAFTGSRCLFVCSDSPGLLAIYDVSGRALVQGLKFGPGKTRLQLAPGVYFLRFQLPNANMTQRVLVLP